MTTLSKAFALAALCIAWSLPVFAQPELSIGLGRTGEDSTMLTLRGHMEPFASGFHWSAGLMASDRGAAWIGAGISYTHHLAGDALFLRGSFMPGLYRAGNDIPLGGPLVFATGLEIGAQMSETSRLSLLFEHRSNAGLYGENPGLDSVSVNYSWSLE